MAYKSLDQCKRELESLAYIAFSKGYKEQLPRECEFLQIIEPYLNGPAHAGLMAVIHAIENNEPVINHIPLDQAAQLAEKAFEYNLPGYNWSRIEREAMILHRRIELAKALRDQDPEDISRAHDALQRTLLNNDRQDSVDGVFAVGDLADQMLNLYEQGLPPGYSTGWPSVDEYYTVRGGEFTVVTGMPGSGKTTWLDDLTVNMWRLHGWNFAFCSPENWPISRHAAHIAEKVLQKPFSRTERFTDRMSKEELSQAIDLMDGSFWFSQLQENSMSVETILQAMERLTQQHPIDGIVLDPWNELEHRRPANKNESEFISEALGRIRRFARFNNIHVWLVAHPQKLRKGDNGTYPVPTPYDISGSAAFYNKADVCLTVHRPKKHDPVTDVHVQKVKFKEVGKRGKASLGYVHDVGSYVDNQQPASGAEASAF
jgi:twinkle protein